MTGFEIFLDVVAVCFVFLLVGEDRNSPRAAQAEAGPVGAEVSEESTIPDKDHEGDRPLAPLEVEVRGAMVDVVVEEVAATPKRTGKGRRAYIESLFDRAKEIGEQEAVTDALLLTVGQVAVNGMRKRG